MGFGISHLLRNGALKALTLCKHDVSNIKFNESTRDATAFRQSNHSFSCFLQAQIVAQLKRFIQRDGYIEVVYCIVSYFRAKKRQDLKQVSHRSKSSNLGNLAQFPVLDIGKESQV